MGDESGDPNAFLKNYFRLVAGFTAAEGGSRHAPGHDDRLHDLTSFAQRNMGYGGSGVSPSMSFNVSSASSYVDDSFRPKLPFVNSTAEISAAEYFASSDSSYPQRRHSLGSTFPTSKACPSSTISNAAVPSLLPPYLTAGQLCRFMWDDLKHREVRCGICTKSISMTDCSLLLHHGRSHCDFESFECLLCHGSSTTTPPYRTNKYQVMYGHMKSAHRGRMIINETWRRLTATEIAKVDEHLVENSSARSILHDDPEEDRKVRDIIFQCFGEWVDPDRLWLKISTTIGDASESGGRRDYGSYYYPNDKGSFYNYRGTASLALPLASASSSYMDSGTSNAIHQGQSMRAQSSSFSHSQQSTASFGQRHPARFSDGDEFSQNTTRESRSVFDKLLAIQEAKAASGQVESVENKKVASPALPHATMEQKNNRARKRVTGGSRSLPALETINQLCQQLRNEASYYGSGVEQRAGGGNSAGERRPRIWCHLCQKPIELPEAASRYMTEHVTSAHTTLKLFHCASCPYEAKTYTQVKAHIKNHHPAIATGVTDDKSTSLKDTFTVNEETMIPLLKACFMPQQHTTSPAINGRGRGVTVFNKSKSVKRISKGKELTSGVHKCGRCSFQSYDREEVRRHRRTTWCAYTWLLVHPCPYCIRFTTRFANVLAKHIARAHSRK